MLERRTAWCRGPAGSVALFVLALEGLAGCSTTIEGPTPKLDDLAKPDVACNASNPENSGIRTTITITSPNGTFSPLPVGTLTDGQTVELPKVYLIQGDKKIEIPDVHFVDTKTMEAVIDSNPPLLAGEYQFQVVNANGKSSNVAAKVRIVDPPVVTSVAAQTNISNGVGAQICTGIENTLTLTGTGFRPTDPTPVVEILTCTDPADLTTCKVETALTNVAVTSDTTLTGILPSGMMALMPGTYAIRVTNPEVPACMGTLQAAIVVVPNPTITSVDPTTAGMESTPLWRCSGRVLPRAISSFSQAPDLAERT